MRAIVTQVINNRPRITTGDVIQIGHSKVIIVVTDKDGGRSIKTFNKSKCSVEIID